MMKVDLVSSIAGPVMALAAFFLGPSTGNAVLIIDEFGITGGLSATDYGYGTPTGVSYSSYDSPVDALGGSRQAFVQILNTTSAPFDAVSVQVANGTAIFSSTANAHGRLGLIYDNLGDGMGLDLTPYDVAGSAFLFQFASPLTVPVQVGISIHGTGAATFSGTAPIGSTSFSVPFLSLSRTGDFQTTGVFSLQTTFSESTDGSGFQLERSQIVPEPATLSLGLVMGGFFLVRRRRESNPVR